MLIEATVIIVLLLLLAFKLWEANSGAFSEMSSLARAMKEMNEDIFRGETRSLRCLVNGEDRFFDVKTVKDACLLYTSPSPRDVEESRMPSSA